MDTPLHNAVAARVGQYEGAYSTLKVAPDMMPARLPNPTKKPVLAARLDSFKSLLLCLTLSAWSVCGVSLALLTKNGQALKERKLPMP